MTDSNVDNEATAFVQQQPVAPDTSDKPYAGIGGESGGGADMLDVIESDIAGFESATCAAEGTSLKQYYTFMTDSKTDEEAKSTSSRPQPTSRRWADFDMPTSEDEDSDMSTFGW